MCEKEKQICDKQNLDDLVCLINSVVDFDRSKEEKRIVPKGDVNEELDELRQVYDNLDSFLVRSTLSQLSSPASNLLPVLSSD